VEQVWIALRWSIEEVNYVRRRGQGAKPRMCSSEKADGMRI
jgi:hypothetical protein